MIATAIFILLLLVVYIIKLNPQRDTLKNGDKIVWYTTGGRFGNYRKFYIYKRHDTQNKP